MKAPKLFYFQEIKEGDVRKFSEVSNDSKSGGGARDLRIRPSADYTELLEPMFPQEKNERVRVGTVHWSLPGGVKGHAEIEYWQPTDARPGEARIGKTSRIEGWRVDEEEFLQALHNRKKWFYTLVLDVDNKLWARVVKEEKLDGGNAEVKSFITARINATPDRDSVRGFMDFSSGFNYPS